MPRLSYQTAVATLIQLITITILGVPDTIMNILASCHNSNPNCASNMIVSIIFYLMTTVWFVIILIVGYAAQKKRSRQLAVVLGGLEFVTLGVAGYLDFPNAANTISKMTSLIDVFLSIWVIYLALRLFLAGGRRVVRKPSIVKRARRIIR